MTTSLINARLTDLFVELAQARRALETCPESERLSIVNRIRVLTDEVHRGQQLLATLSPQAGPEMPPSGAPRSGQSAATFLPKGRT